MASLLAALHAEGELLGAQLCVLDGHSGACLADVAVGHRAWDEPQPVTSTTAFSLGEASKLFVALSVLRLVERGSLALASAVAPGGVTLEHALAHTAGHLEFLYPAVASFAQMCDVDAMSDVAGRTPPLLPPGARQQYHHVLRLAARARVPPRGHLRPGCVGWLRRRGPRRRWGATPLAARARRRGGRRRRQLQEGDVTAD